MSQIPLLRPSALRCASIVLLAAALCSARSTVLDLPKRDSGVYGLYRGGIAHKQGQVIVLPATFLTHPEVEPFRVVVPDLKAPLPLPPHLAALAGDEGHEIFGEAFSGEGNLRPFFPLVQELMTQETESYCGVATLLTILNALGVDPGRTWTPDVPDWDWYGDVTMLNGVSYQGNCTGAGTCCMRREDINFMGMCLSQWVCIARANSLDVVLHAWGNTTIEDFRAALRTMDNSTMVALNFNRAGLGQVGGGHFSPIAGYNAKRDMVLVLDVARFKYVPWWAPVEKVYQSMSNRFFGSTRGFAVVSQSREGSVFPREEAPCL